MPGNSRAPSQLSLSKASCTVRKIWHQNDAKKVKRCGSGQREQEKEGPEGKGLLAFCNMDIFLRKVFGDDGSATLSGVLDVLLQAVLPFRRGMVGRSWVFPPWSLPGWAVGTGTAEFLAGGRQGNAFIYRQPWRRSWKARRKERHCWRVWQHGEGM